MCKKNSSICVSIMKVVCVSFPWFLWWYLNLRWIQVHGKRGQFMWDFLPTTRFVWRPWSIRLPTYFTNQKWWDIIPSQEHISNISVWMVDIERNSKVWSYNSYSCQCYWLFSLGDQRYRLVAKLETRLYKSYSNETKESQSGFQTTEINLSLTVVPEQL